MSENKQNTTLYHIEDIDWKNLEEINIYTEDLIRDGHMERLLTGEKTEYLPINLMHSGITIDIYASMQIIEQDGLPIIEIQGLTAEPNDEIEL